MEVASWADIVADLKTEVATSREQIRLGVDIGGVIVAKYGLEWQCACRARGLTVWHMCGMVGGVCWVIAGVMAAKTHHSSPTTTCGHQLWLGLWRALLRVCVVGWLGSLVCVGCMLTATCGGRRWRCWVRRMW